MEALSFSEGQLHVWTGSHTASGAVIAYCKSVGIAVQDNWQADPAVSGNYRYHIVGQRIDVNASLYWSDSRIATLMAARTALHFKMTHSSLGGSAGFLGYSGRIVSLGAQGSEGQLIDQNFAAFAHAWSAF